MAKPPKKLGRQKNGIAKALRTPLYKMQVVKDKKREAKTKPKTQKEMREDIAEDERCACPWCFFKKDKWQAFCWAHWFDLPSDLRAEIVTAKKADQATVLKRAVKRANALLRVEHDKIIKRTKEIDKWVKENKRKAALTSKPTGKGTS